jgi:hypothetical protein
MKYLLFGIGTGIGLFGACLIAGNCYFDKLKVEFAEDDGDITLYHSPPIFKS